MPPSSPRTVLLRAARLVCPACGRGRIFRTYFARAECCSACGWRFEREEGFWVGGAEVHMFLSYGLSVLLFVPVIVLFGDPLWVKLGAIVGHALLSLLFFRWSRAAFIGIDYLLDPAAVDRTDDDWKNEGEAAPPGRRPPAPRALRHVRRRASV